MFRSVILSKVIVAITGAVLVVFVLGHMAGHLQMFLGQNAYNTYAHNLQSLGPILWLLRISLIVFVTIHIIFTVKLNAHNRASKPIKYQKTTYNKSSASSRNMILAGFGILFFVIYHLLHFTIGKVHTEHFNMLDTMGRHDVFSNMVYSFRNPMISVTYVLAMILLGMHLSHGIQSMFFTLGIDGPNITPKIQMISRLLTILIIGGFILIPVCILLGVIGGGVI